MAYEFARSVSQRRLIRKCGYAYFLRYGMGYRTLHRPGTYAFGDIWQLCVEDVLAGIITGPKSMADVFRQRWALVEHDPATPQSHAWWPEPPSQDALERGEEITCLRCGTFPVRFGKQGTCGPNYWPKTVQWKMLRDRGEALAQPAYTEIVSRCGQGSIEKPHPSRRNQKRVYELAPGVQEMAKPDYEGPCQLQVWNEKGDDFTWSQAPRVETILDWKTSGRQYEPITVDMDEQLTSYQVAHDRLEPETPLVQIGLCVFVYTSTPWVQWILQPAREAEIVEHFVHAALSDDRRIRGEEFARNPDSCFGRYGECDFTPVCIKSQRHRLAAELTQDEWKQAKAAKAALPGW